MISKKLLPYVDFIERNEFEIDCETVGETVWRIHINKTFALGSEDIDGAGVYGFEEIMKKLEELIDVIEKYRV